MNKQEKVIEFLKGLNTEIDILAIVDLDNVTDYQSLYDEIQDNNGFDIDVIYYGSAMEFLTENDTSLRRSLELANELGFSLDSLSSETLASLLKSEIVREEFTELEDEINEFFNELEDDNEEE